MTSRTGRLRASLGALVLMAALTPATAHAQVPGLPPVLNPPQEDPPQENPGRPLPPLPPGLPGADASEEDINAARGRYSNDDTLIPPLERRWKRQFGDEIDSVLIGDRTVFVRIEDRLIAVAGRSGNVLWSKSPPGSGSLGISFEGGRVVTVRSDGTVAALDGISGQLLWQRSLRFDSGGSERLITVSGLAVVTDEDEVHALNLSDGNVRWSKSVRASGLKYGSLADGGRLFLSCGSRALSLSTGSSLWDDGGFCSSLDETAAGNGFVTGAGSIVRNASTGTRVGTVSFPPDVIAPQVTVVSNGGLVTGHRGILGPRMWTAQRSSAGCASSACTDPTGAGANFYRLHRGRVVVNDLATGRQRWSGGPRIPAENHHEPVAGDGILVVRERKALTGYSSVLNPKPTGVQEGTVTAQIQFGVRSRLFGAVGRSIRTRGLANVGLLTDTFPYRRFRRVKAATTFGDGGFNFTVRPRLNTRVRTVVGGEQSSGGTIYVYPRFKERYRRGRGRQINRIRVAVTARAPARVRLGGKRFHMYLVRAKKRRVQRVAGGRLRRAGRGRARGALRFSALRGLRRGDYFFYCVRGLSRQGMGPRDVIDRRCGARRLPY